jgi:hypothetical protein
MRSSKACGSPVIMPVEVEEAATHFSYRLCSDLRVHLSDCNK